MPCVCSSLPDLPGPDMSFIFDWIYSGFSSVLQFLGEFISVCALAAQSLQMYLYVVVFPISCTHMEIFKEEFRNSECFQTDFLFLSAIVFQTDSSAPNSC